jgi:hypothetical protein
LRAGNPSRRGGLGDAEHLAGGLHLRRRGGVDPLEPVDQAQLGLLLASEPVMTQDVDALDVAERCDVRRVALELLGGSPEASCPTFRFAERLAALRKTVWVRYVLVPGWNDLTRPALRAARICGV